MDSDNLILIVDNEHDLSKILLDSLRMQNYMPVVVDTRQRALEWIERKRPPVVLIDFKREDIYGLKLLREINIRFPDTECIVFTADTTQGTKLESGDLSAYGYLLKPYEIEQLLMMISGAIEKRKAHRMLHDHESQMHSLYNSIPIPTITWQPNGEDFVLTDYNAASMAVTEGRIANLWGTKASEVYREYPDIQEELTRCFSEEITSEREVNGHLIPGGPYHYFQAKYTFMPPDKIVVYMDDITERKQTEESLQKLAHNLGERVKELSCLYSITRLVERPDATIESILQGTVELIPPSWQYPEITCARIMLEGTIYSTANFKETPWKQSSNIIVHGAPIGTLDVFYLKEKTEADEGPFLKEERDLIDAIAERLARDIERKRLEANAAAVREAEQVQRLRAEAMAALSHELRTPLAVIKGYATSLLLEEVEWGEPKRHEFLRLIDEECDNLQTMVTNILDSSQISTGQMVIELQPVRLPQFITEIIEGIQRLTGRHQMIVDFPLDFPILDIDPHWMRQVFQNILDNALKYSPDGGMVIVKGEQRLTDVVISIADQGVGIAPEDLISLFEKYFRVKSPTGYYVAGTGLGLPVSRAIVEAHGGRIWVESKVEQGTTLYFSLPLGVSSSNLKE